MPKTCITAMLIVMVLGMLASCHHPDYYRSGGYPPTWPIPKLTIPTGASFLLLDEQARAERDHLDWVDAEVYCPGQSYEYKIWMLSFYSKQPDDLVLQHFDETLEAEGYLCKPLEVGTLRRQYLSPDSRFSVNLDRLQIPGSPGIPDYDGWRITIEEYTNPLANPYRSEFKPID